MLNNHIHFNKLFQMSRDRRSGLLCKLPQNAGRTLIDVCDIIHQFLIQITQAFPTLCKEHLLAFHSSYRASRNVIAKNQLYRIAIRLTENRWLKEEVLHVGRRADVVATNSDITIDGAENGLKQDGSGVYSFVADGDSVITLKNADDYDIVLGENATVEIKDEASLTALTSNIANGDNLSGNYLIRANTIVVNFEKADVDAAGNDTDEQKDIYNIVLAGSDALTINRLNSVDLTFALAQKEWGKNAYTIIASNDEVAVNNVEGNRYEFHYNGKDGVKSDVGTKIEIGQVEIDGYGKYTFAVDGSVTTNVAHATTYTDNIVDTYIPNGATVGKGNLDVDDSSVSAENKVPTRELVINIDFNNAVETGEEGYQQMKVEVYGGDLEKTVEIKLSDADQNDVNPELKGKADARYSVDVSTNKYVVALSKVLTVNTTYNVKVSGAGYRDAYYTVTMNEGVTGKTLNFWNNVKDVAAEVENNKPSSAKEVTFLAGDIVKDNIINIYDLSAVVSYFGEEKLVETNNTGYAKYDLNRDGKIDSKDVAYVLVSWNK